MYYINKLVALIVFLQLVEEMEEIALLLSVITTINVEVNGWRREYLSLNLSTLVFKMSL